MERTITYFEDIRAENTETVFRLAEERAGSLGIKKIVLASTTGTTAMKAVDFFKGKGIKLIVVPHQFGFRETHGFRQELIKPIRDAGHEVHIGTMLFHTENLYDSSVPTLMANLLRCFCQGIKVCFEIVLMTTDAGHVTIGEKVIAVAGTGRGADTAVVIQAASSRNLKKLRVNETLCKPLNPINVEKLREREKKVVTAQFH